MSCRRHMLVDPVWVPEDIQALVVAAEDGVLDERHDFDAKRELPASNKELAKDIAAMTTDGGSLVYGIGEDADGRPRLPRPIELDGAAERIDQVAQNSISGSPKLEFVHLRIPEDGARGYLLVVIPASPEAPHQVTVGNDRRFYGRSDTGNRRLAEEEIARLYERRSAHGQDRRELLDQCIRRSPAGAPPKDEFAFLQAFVQPVLSDDELWERAAGRDGERALMEELRQAAASAVAVTWGGQELHGAVNWRRVGADTWSLTSVAGEEGEEGDLRWAVRADVDMDGRAYLFYGDAAESIDHNGHRIFTLFERGIAITLAQFLGLTGALYEAGGLHGPVDVGMAVTGIAGAISAHSLGDARFQGRPYGEDSATRTRRCDARELREEPAGVALSLLGRLFSASTGYDFDPLAEQ